MPTLVEQPTNAPTRKVKYGAAASALASVPAAVVVSMLARWFDLDVTAEEAIVVGSLFGSAFSAVGSFLGGYFTREEDTPNNPRT